MNKRSTRIRSLRRQRAGAVAVEFSIVAMVFLTMVFACMEFARISMLRNLMQDAAYFAARKAMVPGAVMQDAVNEAMTILTPAGARGVIVSVNSGSELSSDTTQISVRVTLPVSQNAVLYPYVLPTSNLVTTAVMKTERYDTFYDGSN